MSAGQLAVAKAHAVACWNLVAQHCQQGRCTCHLDVGGSVHIIQGCVTGRMLNDEYAIAAERVRDLSASKLEAGDMESTLEPERAA